MLGAKFLVLVGICTMSVLPIVVATPTLVPRQVPLSCPAGDVLQCCQALEPLSSIPGIGSIILPSPEPGQNIVIGINCQPLILLGPLACTANITCCRTGIDGVDTICTPAGILTPTPTLLPITL